MASRSASSLLGELLRAQSASARAPASALLRTSASQARAYGMQPHGYGGHGQQGPLFGHPLGHAPVVPMMPGYEMSMHATTILSVRKNGKVVRNPWQLHTLRRGLRRL